MVDGKPVSDIRVAEVLEEAGKTVRPATVRIDAPLKDAVEAIVRDSETRKVYVVDNDDKLMGTITLEVLLRHVGYRLGVRSTGMTSFLRMLAEITDENVKEVMAKPVKVSTNELLVNVTKLMVENHLNDLPVVDDKGVLVDELNGLDIIKLGMQYWE